MNPKHPFHDAADAPIEIEAAQRVDRGLGDTRVARPLVASRLGWVVIASLVAVNALVAWSWRRSTRDAPAPRETTPTALRAVVQLPADTTLVLGRGSAVAFSPDGRRIVYTAESKGTRHLYLRSLDRFDSTLIPGSERATDPFFSPDGQWLGFFADEKLKKIPVDGGTAMTLADAQAPRGQAWGIDDTIFITPRDNTGLWRVRAHGGKLEPATTLADGESSHRWPQVLPGGKGLLYTIWSGGWETAQIVMQPLDGGARRVLLTGGGCGQFVRDETGDRAYLVYARAEGLMAVPFDPVRLAVTAQPVPIVDGVITNLSGGAHFAVSATGSLAYVSESGSVVERELVWTARNGAETHATTLRGMNRSFNLSPDGTRIARYNTDGLTRDVRAEDLSKGASTRISVRTDPVSPAPPDRLNAVWSADGNHVAYGAGLPMNLFRASPGGGREERLTTSRNPQWPASWSPDGKTLAFVEFDPLSGSDIWLLDVDTARKPGSARPFLRTPFTESAPAISPNGRWLAYQSNESGRFEVYVQPFPEGGRRWQVSTDHGVYPRWSRRGDELFFRSGPTRAGMTSVSVTWDPDFHPGASRVLFDARRYESTFDVSPDGHRFLMMPMLPPTAGATQMNVVVNWLDELRRQVP